MNGPLNTWKTVVLIMFGVGLMTIGCRSEQSAGFDFSNLSNYVTNPNSDNYQRYETHMESAGDTKPGALSEMIDKGADFFRKSDNDLGGALKNALRNIDDTANPGSPLYKLGKGAEVFDFMSRAVKVSDEYNKGKGGHSYDAAVKAGRELIKMFSGNYSGGAAVSAIISSGGGAIPAFLIGYAASKGVEGFLQTMYNTYDTLKERSRDLTDPERARKMAAEMKKAQGIYEIPDTAVVSTFEDENGNTMQETTWTDPDTGQGYSYAAWYNSYGHELGTDFDKSEFMEARKEAVGGDYRRKGQSTVGKILGTDEQAGSDTDESESDNQEDGEDDEDASDPARKRDPKILDYVMPQRVIAQASTQAEISYGQEIATITTTFNLVFTNVGELVEGYEKAVLSVVEKMPDGKESKMTWTGTFSGGPNGVFKLTSEDGKVTIRLKNGQVTEDVDGISMTVTKPDAFSGWPKDFR